MGTVVVFLSTLTEKAAALFQFLPPIMSDVERIVGLAGSSASSMFSASTREFACANTINSVSMKRSIR